MLYLGPYERDHVISELCYKRTILMLYLGPYERDHVISELCYKGTILHAIFGSMWKGLCYKWIVLYWDNITCYIWVHMKGAML